MSVSGIRGLSANAYAQLFVQSRKEDRVLAKAHKTQAIEQAKLKAGLRDEANRKQAEQREFENAVTLAKQGLSLVNNVSALNAYSDVSGEESTKAINKGADQVDVGKLKEIESEEAKIDKKLESLADQDAATPEVKAFYDERKKALEGDRRDALVPLLETQLPGEIRVGEVVDSKKLSKIFTEGGGRDDVLDLVSAGYVRRFSNPTEPIGTAMSLAEDFKVFESIGDSYGAKEAAELAEAQGPIANAAKTRHQKTLQRQEAHAEQLRFVARQLAERAKGVVG